MKIDMSLDVSRAGPPALIVVGRNGAGKSTLTNTIFGKNIAEIGTRADVTLGVSKYTLPQSGVEIFDTPGHGGLDEDAEQSLRKFLQLDTPQKQMKPIPADMIIYVFTYERLTRQEFEFFREIDTIYKNRIIVVKNYRSDEKEGDFKKNYREIQTRIGRNPICVDALKGINIDDLVREIFRFLSPDKLLDFNSSLETRRRRARELSSLYTIKVASLVAVYRSQRKGEIKSQIEQYKKELTKGILKAYIDEMKDEEVLKLAQTGSSYGVIENDFEERGKAAVFGGGLGMLIGLLGGPFGMAIGGLLGSLFGASSVPQISRGGAPAVINIISQGYGLSEIIEDSFNEPIMLLTQSEEQMKKWLKSNKRKILGTLEDATVKAEYAIKDSALIGYLNNPNVQDPALVELKLRPVIDFVFKN